MSRKTLLFITGNRLGDAVLSSGVLDHFMKELDGPRVTIACGALPAPLFADTPGLEAIHTIYKTKSRRTGHWVDLWHRLPSRRWTAVVDIRSFFFAWMVRAEKRWICRAEKRREHRVEELGRQLGIAPPPEPHLFVSAERRARIDATIDLSRPILAVAPTANWGGKQWPAERFAETIGRLIAPGGMLAGARLAVFGAAHERDAALPVLEATPDPLDLFGCPDLLDAFALLRRCALFFGNDSGIMHMAAAAGIPTLGLFGPSAEWRYRPWGKNGAVVRTPESLEEIIGVPGYQYWTHDSRMLGLTVESVMAALGKLAAAQ